MKKRKAWILDIPGGNGIYLEGYSKREAKKLGAYQVERNFSYTNDGSDGGNGLSDGTHRGNPKSNELHGYYNDNKKYNDGGNGLTSDKHYYCDEPDDGGNGLK